MHVFASRLPAGSWQGPRRGGDSRAEQVRVGRPDSLPSIITAGANFTGKRFVHSHSGEQGIDHLVRFMYLFQGNLTAVFGSAALYPVYYRGIDHALPVLPWVNAHSFAAA